MDDLGDVAWSIILVVCKWLNVAHWTNIAPQDIELGYKIYVQIYVVTRWHIYQCNKTGIIWNKKQKNKKKTKSVIYNMVSLLVPFIKHFQAVIIVFKDPENVFSKVLYIIKYHDVA